MKYATAQDLLDSLAQPDREPTAPSGERRKAIARSLADAGCKATLFSSAIIVHATEDVLAKRVELRSLRSLRDRYFTVRKKNHPLARRDLRKQLARLAKSADRTAAIFVNAANGLHPSLWGVLLVRTSPGPARDMIRASVANNRVIDAAALWPYRNDVRAAANDAVSGKRHRKFKMKGALPRCSKPGPKQSAVDAWAVMRLAAIYENATGRKAAAGYSDVEKTMRDGPFVRFVRTCLSPDEISGNVIFWALRKLRR
jgi:hypothetical protein